ncbi:hypothetical protein M409DRAFT_25397 [Zasmidium cellare ATCC 36951]|uniref:DUF2406 domain-containing protein n=1 Tax=Zasmidium cellare ATCC 36951 TaxID=1080233 RepID=A0A6A6CE58_ZASCE|nr:uncharacterized protein M409DRAFT_25397 [Zasmidium cellare ATCC 36951]KAF2164520.1 hypothetical protein M409DRAFT_25397 [Zasmidium cellare ATCC 36951]
MDQGPQSPGARSHGSRTFSFRSDKSGGSKPKEDLHDSPREKQRRDSIWKATSKANPNAALSEAQPGVNAIFEDTTITPLRGIQHKDTTGNVITDPDLSNPTRPRMERPLDTIKAFERAIDNGYKRRSGYQRSESYEQSTQYGGSRRNSAYGGHEGSMSPNRFSNGNGGGYYGGQRDSYGPGPSGPPRRYPAQRMQSEPMMYGGGPRPYPHGHQASQDTMNTGVTNGSDSTGPWANSTDPSSENSSVERGPSAQKPHGEYPPNGYGHNGYQNGYGPGGFQGPIPEEGGSYPMGGGAPPVQPPNAARRPIPLGNTTSDTVPELPSTKRPEPEKRKSWLKRRFSKKD